MFQADPAFELEKQRHEAVLAFQKSVIEKQQRIAAQNDASAQRQAFANNSTGFTSDQELPEAQAVEVGAPVQQVGTFKIIVEMSSSFFVSGRPCL